MALDFTENGTIADIAIDTISVLLGYGRDIIRLTDTLRMIVHAELYTMVTTTLVSPMAMAHALFITMVAELDYRFIRRIENAE